MTPRRPSSSTRRESAGKRRRGPAASEAFDAAEEERGLHTLRVVRGTVEGIDGRDVFVDLGPRMQGVLPLSRFGERPERGSSHEFTLRGQEDGLWVLELAETLPMPSWESMQVGSLVEARGIGANPGGVECKIGRLHGFMPRSETGLGRREPTSELVGKHFWAEVTEVDPERQRVLLSRKLARRRLDEGAQSRGAQSLSIGSVVPARVERLLPYGAVLRLDRGLRGFLHVSDIDHERVEDPADRLTVDGQLDVKVLAIRRGGARIALGLKQLLPSPWAGLERRVASGALLAGEITSIRDFGAFVRVARGVTGLLRTAESDVEPGRSLRQVYSTGQRLVVRAVTLDVERERLALSRYHRDGRRIVEDEAELEPVDLSRLEVSAEAMETPLGRMLGEALGRAAEVRAEPKRA